MITATNTTVKGILLKIAIVPIFTGLLFVSCAEESESGKPENATEQKTMPVQKVYSADAVNTQPQYPGGMAGFYRFVNENFKIPETDKDLTAKIYVSFVVEEDGSMSDIKILRDPGYGLGDEALRVLKLNKEKWTPGKKDGKPVRTNYTLPITINIVQ